jgi:hypothetical protein
LSDGLSSCETHQLNGGGDGFRGEFGQVSDLPAQPRHDRLDKIDRCYFQVDK